MAQFGILLEKMSRAQALSTPVASLPVARNGIEAGDGPRQLDDDFSHTITPAAIGEGSVETDFKGLLQALDRHDEETASANAKAKIEAERQMEMMERELGMGGVEIGSGPGMGMGMGSAGLDWMGFGSGPEELGGDEDFSALLDLNAFASEPNTGNMFGANLGEITSNTNVNAAAYTENTSPLIDSSFASAVSTLLSSFDTSGSSLLPGSTATQLFSEFSSPEDVNLGNMFPPLAQHSRRPTDYNSLDAFAQPSADFATDAAAFEDVNLASLADRGVFSLPLMGGFHAQQHTSPVMGTQSPAAMGSSLPAGSPRDLFGPPSTPVITSSPLVSERAIPIPASPRPFASPALSVAQLYVGGRAKASVETTPALKKKKPYEPNGTRNSRPLLDASAPTMTKKYAAPGKTTRKVIPVGFQKKLKLQSNESGDADLPDDADGEVVNELMNEIEEKRRKNCVAARESRKRKLDFQNGLKDEIKGWREWSEQVEALLKSVGREDLFAMLPEQPEAMSMEE